MPAPAITFYSPHDVHLIRGQIAILRDLVSIGGQNVASYLSAHSNITLTFSVNFKGSLSGGIYSGLSIDVYTDSTFGGLINTNTPGPADDINNFLLTATVTDTNDSTTSEAVIRIHIHRSIKQAWLSPALLTAQKGINGFRLSVRARFDDDVEAEIGDIYDMNTGSVINYNYGTTKINIAWSSPTANLISGTGDITPGAALAVGSLHNVSAVLSCPGINLAQGGGATVTANGQIIVVDQLSGSRPDITAELVATGNCPGFAKIDEVPNVLFIPDGFHVEDRNVFDTIVDKYISDLTTGKYHRRLIC